MNLVWTDEVHTLVHVLLRVLHQHSRIHSCTVTIRKNFSKRKRNTKLLHKLLKAIPLSKRYVYNVTNVPPHGKTNKITCAASEDSVQPGHPPSLIRRFAVRMTKAWVLSYQLSAQRRLWSDCADVQADLSLRCVHMSFCWFCHAAVHFRWFAELLLKMRINASRFLAHSIWGLFCKSNL